ncbi:hypothetical protein [Aurantiacibacter zhengii]|uniref:Uncharacterized protein n=1 Tax=Aurantiacibacter zhengii TaxID=2307003 RepID=A0A418NTS0_9SPHN|nr:hypothetical protein [Aurantiacibacter zhengii]RIV87547.1 hypothetical protein D2V07_04150 [Aurantiacibacter zhengii]
MTKRALAGLSLAITFLFAPISASAADWYRAETEHFIVYAEDSETDTREFAQDLERLDEVLSILTGVAMDEELPESSKVSVFRFGETSDMSVLLAGNRNTGVGGFFIGRANGSVAFVPRQRNKRRERSAREAMDTDMMLDPKATLFHEYVHYFMFQHRDAPYPLWYSEGFAELFSNLEFNEDNFVIGEVPPWRSASLATIPIDLEKTFDPPRSENGREAIGRRYAHGWLIASHLNLNAERRGQMGEYMVAIGEGADPMEAAERAFGDLEVLRQELEDFRRGAARTLRVPYAVNADPAVDIRRLSADEEARMDLMIKSKRGVDEEGAARLVSEARALVQQYPSSAPVLLAATEAEFDARNYDEAEQLAQRVLELDPDSTDAANYYADAALRRSYQDPSQLEVARSRFAAANRMETDHAYPLYGYYLTYLFDDEPVPDQAKMALEASFRYAPFDDTVRRTLVHMLLEEDRAAEARVVGASYLTGNGGFACLMRKKFAEFEAGDREGLLEDLRPDHPGEYKDEAARDAEQEEYEAEVEAYGCDED